MKTFVAPRLDAAALKACSRAHAAARQVTLPTVRKWWMEAS